MDQISELPKMLRASDVAGICRVCEAKAYEIIRILNKEIQKKGYITISGRVSKNYFLERLYLKEE